MDSFNNKTDKPLTLSELYKELKQNLNSSEASKEAQIILESTLNIEYKEVISNGDLPITRSQLKKIYEIRDKRNTGLPLAYILEEAYFMDMKLFVNEDVLIPRPETELLVEKVLEEIKKRRIHHPVILDLCTGSGCIAVALKKFLPAATVYASDISKAALNVASINAQRYKLEINFVWGDYLEPFIKGQSTKPNLYSPSFEMPIIRGEPPFFDVIVSNPPYVSEEDYKKLEPELFYEPKHALVGFPYKIIRDQVFALQKPLLKPKGFLAFEYGLDQAHKIQEIYPKSKIYKDYADIERMAICDLD